MTSIYPFANALRVRQPAAAAQVTALLAGQSILAVDDFGTGEINNGGNVNNLPLYTNIAADDANHPVRSIGDADNYYNALGNRRYLRFVNPTARVYTNIRARSTPTTGRDPEIFLWRNGQLIASATNDSTVAGPGRPVGTEILEVANLPAGEYVIEVYDSINVYPDDPDTDTGNTLLTVRISP